MSRSTTTRATARKCSVRPRWCSRTAISSCATARSRITASGARVLLFAISTGELQKQLAARVGQCVLTSPGSACYADLAGEETLRLGNALRYFGDGWQISKRFGARHFWRIPVMDGEFICEAT